MWPPKQPRRSHDEARIGRTAIPAQPSRSIVEPPFYNPSRDIGRALLLVTIVNACLRDGRGGSPTAVLEEASLTELERCQVPKLMGTSHAVFVSADGGDLDRPLASLRFFTATGELPGCGHGTVAALAFLAHNAGRDPYHVTLHAAERSFAGEVTQANGNVSAAFDPGAVQLREATVDERVVVLDALGHDPDILVPEICVASLGRPRLLVPLSTPTAVAGLEPDYDRLRDVCDRLGLLGCYVHSVPTTEGRLSARMFAPSIGVPEDIANANSTACLAARLAQRKMTRINVDMGDSLGSPATITATTQQTGLGAQIRVGGAAKVIQTLRLERGELNRTA
jgi:trans-2,3-dihydro-3-hydroxyanthranilate isomerase